MAYENAYFINGSAYAGKSTMVKMLSEKYDMQLVASGGVSSYEDIVALKNLGIHGAIIGKAYYVGAIDLEVALKEALK